MADYQGTVLVLGANGETGWRTVRALRAKNIATRAMVRSADRINDTLRQPGVEVFVGSVLDDYDLRRALVGAKAVINTLGRRADEGPEIMEAIEYTTNVRLVAAALENQVEHIVLCSSMGTETPEMIPPIAAILRAKRRGELALEHSGITYTIVRPGGLINDPGGGDVLAMRRIPGFGRIARDDVAEVLVQALLQPAARNVIVEIIHQPGAGKADRPTLFAQAAP